MNRKKRMAVGSAGLCMILAVSSILCFPTPTTARVINQDVFSIQIGQTEEKAAIESNLLAEGGQTILLNGDFTELQVPITLACKNLNMISDTEIAGKITAVSSDEDKIQVSLDKEDIIFEETETKVHLIIQRIEKAESDESVDTEELPDEEQISDEEQTPDEEGETTPGTEESPDTEVEAPSEGESETTPDTEVETPSEGESETTPDPEESPNEGDETTSEMEETEASEPEEQITTETEETPDSEELQVYILPQLITGTAIEEEAVEETDNEAENETIPELDTSALLETESQTEEELITVTETGSETEETQDTEIETETETLSVEVTFTYQEQSFSATFIIEEAVQTADLTAGELAFCPSQYHPTKEFEISNAAEQECTLSGFPAMTRYTLEEQTNVLYTGGNICIPAGKSIIVDLSMTGIKEDLLITTDGEKSYTLKYVELPELSEELLPLIVNEEGKELPISGKWGTIDASVRIEHLTEGEEAPVWEATEIVLVDKSENDLLEIEPNGAVAGTYRAIVSWIENERTLYEMEIPFFIQYESVSQGGIGQ